MLLLTTDTVPHCKVEEILGLVVGASVRSCHAGGDVTSLMHNMVGGEMFEYTKVLAEVREQSIDRMVEQARALGADAIIGLRFASTEIASNAGEMLAYGTAVRLAEERTPGKDNAS